MPVLREGEGEREGSCVVRFREWKLLIRFSWCCNRIDLFACLLQKKMERQSFKIVLLDFPALSALEDTLASLESGEVDSGTRR